MECVLWTIVRKEAVVKDAFQITHGLGEMEKDVRTDVLGHALITLMLATDALSTHEDGKHVAMLATATEPLRTRLNAPSAIALRHGVLRNVAGDHLLLRGRGYESSVGGSRGRRRLHLHTRRTACSH
jgi:hypothetical protein